MVLALVLVATSVLLFTKGAAAAPGDSKAETLSRQYEDVTAAAREQTLAFLTVDYKNMDPLTDKVLAGATGRSRSSTREPRPTSRPPPSRARRWPPAR